METAAANRVCGAGLKAGGGERSRIQRLPGVHPALPHARSCWELEEAQGMEKGAGDQRSAGRAQPQAKPGYRHARPAQPIAPVENIKEMQQKLKEEKEAKRAQLDGRHDYILDIVASCVDLDKAEVEDAILEGNQIERINKFLATEGFRHIMFYYQDVETPETGHFGPPGTGPNPHSARSKKPKVFVTEGIDVALTGVCVFFIRASPSKTITAENIHREVNFNMLDTAQGGLLKSVQHLLSEIFIPVIKTMNQGWGEVGSPQQAANIRQDFLGSLEGFVSVLSGAQQSLMEKVNLKKCDTYDLKTLKGPSDYLAVANSTEALERIEACMKVWIKQIEQVMRCTDLKHCQLF